MTVVLTVGIALITSCLWSPLEGSSGRGSYWVGPSQEELELYERPSVGEVLGLVGL